MGNCVAGGKHPPNFFFVKNINEDKNLVQRGLLEVSDSELVYTDNASSDKWTWPLRYLRKYGCDGEVFSFEAGRKCPGGEGLYAFSSKRASKIFELVARNINQGEQVQNGEVSPFPSETRPPDLATMSFVRPQTPPTARSESNYTNIGQNGIPLAQAEQAPPPEPPKGQYVPVEFPKSPAEHPAPQPNPDNPLTSYTQIDFEKTEQISRDRIHGTLLDDGNPHRTSGSVSLPPSRAQNHRHRRLNTVSSATSHNRRSSESSYSSQSSLTESSRNLTSPQVNGHALGAELAGVTYQNVVLAQAQAQAAGQQGLYQNVNLKPGSNVGEVFNESRYANMDYQSRHHSVANGNGAVTPIRVNGIGTYAEVVPGFRNRATSTPIAQDSYTQLEFTRDKTPSSADSILSPPSIPLVPQPSLTGHLLPPEVNISAPVGKGRDERAGSTGDLLPPPTTRDGLEVIDENRVTYGTLNFPAMHALTETSREREQELSANNHDSSDRLVDKDSRERKTSTSLFKRSHKEKDK